MLTTWTLKLGLATAALVVGVAAGSPAIAQDKTLYERLGRYDAIAAVVDDFIGRFAADPQLTRFLAGHSTESKGRLRQLIVEQVCMATGGPCVYTGRSTKASHAGLGITEREWEMAVDHLAASLDKFHVPAREKGELLGLLTKMKGDIVEK